MIEPHGIELSAVPANKEIERTATVSPSLQEQEQGWRHFGLRLIPEVGMH
jgi:hypothetical protein